MSEPLPETEGVDPETSELDVHGARGVVRAVTRAGRRAADAVAACEDELSSAVEMIAQSLARGGRLHYVGAGTSGRLGVLDASEMPPTFGTDPHLVCAHIAGGDRALRSAVEGAEDDAAAGAREMHGHVMEGDVVVGISASGGAPYVAAALAAAREIGARTIAIVNTLPPTPMTRNADATIALRTGAEPLAGSTRLTAGTAQKIALNALSTGAMVLLGKVYGNAMVDVVATNDKLHARARRLVRTIGGVDDETAARLLQTADGRVKTAIVMARTGSSATDANAALDRVDGFLRRVIE